MVVLLDLVPVPTNKTEKINPSWNEIEYYRKSTNKTHTMSHNHKKQDLKKSAEVAFYLNAVSTSAFSPFTPTTN